jgi:hypothetical protein
MFFLSGLFFGLPIVAFPSPNGPWGPARILVDRVGLLPPFPASEAIQWDKHCPLHKARSFRLLSLKVVVAH